MDDGEEPVLASAELYKLAKEMEAFLMGIEPTQMLVFTTGASGLPTTGFDPAPRTEFVTTHEGNNLPFAVTCSNTLYLPVNKETVNPMIFCRAMAHALIGANNFFGKM